MLSDRNLKHLLVAIVAQAVRDCRHYDEDVRSDARTWLLENAEMYLHAAGVEACREQIIGIINLGRRFRIPRDPVGYQFSSGPKVKTSRRLYFREYHREYMRELRRKKKLEDEA